MDPTTKQLLVGVLVSICNDNPLHKSFPGNEMPESRLEVVQIYFDTASFDEIERDKRIKFEAQLSLIGGTMGLLSGFSIISGVEIINFLIKYIYHTVRTSIK